MAIVYAGVERTIALMVTRSGEMDALARRIKGLAHTIGNQKGVGEDYLSSITIHKAGRGLDRIISVDDPLAAAKEFGHVIRNQPDGPVLGYVRGFHVMRGVYARLAVVE